MVRTPPHTNPQVKQGGPRWSATHSIAAPTQQKPPSLPHLPLARTGGRTWLLPIPLDLSPKEESWHPATKC
jgi:hypothetical protein